MKTLCLAREYSAGYANGDINVPHRLTNALDCTKDSRPAIAAYWQGVADRMRGIPKNPPRGLVRATEANRRPPGKP